MGDGLRGRLAVENRGRVAHLGRVADARLELVVAPVKLADLLVVPRAGLLQLAQKVLVGLNQRPVEKREVALLFIWKASGCLTWLMCEDVGRLCLACADRTHLNF